MDLLKTCGDGALTELAEPTTTVIENGVDRGASLTTMFVRDKPPGLVLKVSTTVLGSSRTLAVADRHGRARRTSRRKRH